MSVETITVIVSFATLLLSFFGAFGWMIRHTDARIDRLDEKLSSRMDGMQRELVEVKIAVARLEGPPRRLVTTR